MRLAVFLLCALLANCGGGETAPAYQDPNDKDPPAIPNKKAYPPDSKLTCDSGSSLTYAGFGGSFFGKYCRSCHSSSVTGADRRGAPTDVDFDTAAAAQIWRGEILGRLGGGAKKMPPSGDIDSRDLKAVKEWLGCGAPPTAG